MLPTAQPRILKSKAVRVPGETEHTAIIEDLKLPSQKLQTKQMKNDKDIQDLNHTISHKYMELCTQKRLNTFSNHIRHI